MRYSIILPVFAAAALAQSGNPSTNSLGVVTGQPLPVTTQPRAVTTQPAVATSQTAAAVVPAGQNSTFVTPITNPTGSAASAGTSRSANVTVIGTGSLRSTVTSSASSRSSGGSSSSSSSSRSGTATSSGSTTSSTAKPASAADMVQPVLGLGLAGVIFAAFL